jgi:diguanylate cyclase (GGDEF)-like protein/PAS domain S-box-containing protein
MPIVRSSLQRPLSKRLMPLAYALVAVVGLILALTWGALQIQVTLAGFLNGESVWSKAQKQAVIDLEAYARSGDDIHLDSFRRNASLLAHDRWARDAIAGGDFDRQAVEKAFADGSVIHDAIPGMIFILQYFSRMPYMKQAEEAWRSTDVTLDELALIADRLQQSYAHGGLSTDQIEKESDHVKALNRFIEPRSNLFSLEIAQGASWLGRVLFGCVLIAAILASLLWMGMARRILNGIRGTEERYSLLFDSAGDAIVMVDDDSGRILDVNRTAAAWTGRDKDALVGDTFAALYIQDSVSSDGRSAIGTLRGAHGRTIPVETQSSQTRWGDRAVSQAIIRDISERVAMEQERRVAAEALASIAEGLIIADTERRIVNANAALTQLTGFTLQDLQGSRFDNSRSMPDGTPMPSSVWETIAREGNWQGEVLSSRRDGSAYPESLSISSIRDGNGVPLHYVAVFTDITSSKADQMRLRHLASHDPLTGLVTRAEFERRCALAILAARSSHGAAAVLFVDLDAFKVVNDSYSHAIGDSLLAEVAERIRGQLGPHDVAGRIGGDEFTVLLANLGVRENATEIAGRLLLTLAEPFTVGDYEIFMSASIGIAGYPLDGADPVTLIANADAAMYAAKTEERNAFRFYTPKMHADARRRLQLAAELRQALAREEFTLLFQPSVELRSGRIVAVEALVRWQHPERGEVMPDEFIPIAESLGLIRHIDDWVMRNACDQLKRWDQARMPPIRLAVNVSAGSFAHPELLEHVRTVLQATGLAPSRLLLEITESAILRLGDDTVRTMHALHNLGVGVAIDDFGTGYSSLAYLKLPSVAFLKIDRSFTAGLPANANDAAITEAMIAISKTLGLCTIAEGIENAAQQEFLLRAGCIEGQGYFFSRPLAAVDVERLLSPRSQHAPARLTVVPPRAV